MATLTEQKVIRLGEDFGSYAEFRSALEKYETEQLCNFPIDQSVRDPHDNIIVYKTIRLRCKKYGQHLKTSHVPKTSSYKDNCDSYISVSQKIVNNVKVLRIVTLKDQHNQERSVELFKHMTKQRRKAIEKNKKELVDLLSVKSSKKVVQKRVNEQAEGVVTLKDLHNLHQKSRENVHNNDLVALVEEMIKIENAAVKVIKNDQDELECILFQDERMKHFFNLFPDLIMFDGTYCLNDRRMPLVVILVIDGNGESQIAGFCIVKSENTRTFLHMFEEFKKENPRHTDIDVIMSDKSFANRNVFRAAFPNAIHQLCVFHVFQIFAREITPKKRKISATEKTTALNILRRMVYAKNSNEYDSQHTKLVRMNCPDLLAYFNDNWHGIKDQWVGFLVNQQANYENRTNNRLESFNQKIKSVVSKYSRLTHFFQDLMTCIASYNIERDHKAADSILRKSLVTDLDKLHDKQYSKFLTKYAYDKYRLQSMKSSQIQFNRINEREAESVENNVNILTTDANCECVFFKTMKLPCAHIYRIFGAS